MLAATAAVLSGVVVCANAQSLGEIARRIEEARKSSKAGAVVYDERDVDPSLARRDLLELRLDTAMWQRFLAAERRVAAAVVADPELARRVEGLNYVTLRSLGHFFQSEEAIAAALTDASVDPHEYANVYLAAKLALSNSPDALATAPQANSEFLRNRWREVAALTFRLDTLSLHALRAAPRPQAGTAAPALSARHPRAETRSPAAPASGVIDISAGAQIPDFDFVDFNGRARRLSDFHGKYLLLDFWGSWCPPCRAEVPFVRDAYARFGSRGFEVLGMDSERDATVDDVRSFLKKNGVQWTFATPDSVRSLINDRFQITSFPRVILLGPDGRVIEARNGALRGENLGRTLERLLPK